MKITMATVIQGRGETPNLVFNNIARVQQYRVIVLRFRLSAFQGRLRKGA